MKEDNIDVVCFTGHKSLMGPQGTGGLCVRKGVEIRPLLSGGSGILTFEKEHPSAMPVRLEAGTLNTHGIAGLLAVSGISWKRNAGRIFRRKNCVSRSFFTGN